MQSDRRFSLGGAALLAAMTMAAGSASAATTYAVIHNFLGGASDAAFPKSGLISDSSGNLYGTGQAGGTGTLCEYGCGTVFKLAPNGSVTVLHSFTGGATDGVNPTAGLVADSSGNLYGATQGGGAKNAGTVFKVSEDGSSYSVLHSFSGGGSDGARPVGGLIIDSLGNLYGTTQSGGPLNSGVVFELAPDGTLTLLKIFAGSSDGAGPVAGLYADASSNLYGTASSGGTVCNTCGLVFGIHPDGYEKTLHYFMGPPNDGTFPMASLIADSSGNFYGTTSNGGTSNAGTVFKLSPSGVLTVLHSFSGSDGAFPAACLIIDSSGNLYGTAPNGGAWNKGVVFKVSQAGTFTVLHSFTGGLNDGGYPYGGLTADSSGNLYGTASTYGTANKGVVFQLSGTGFLAAPRRP
jgi:uncharacterized repeat protein (TIGR03803 family)